MILLYLLLAYAATSQIPGRYTQEIFTNISETNDIIFSTSVPQPKRDNSNLIVLFGGPSIAVLEYNTDPVTLRMDIFEPESDLAVERPLIILGFGGGFVQGSRDYWSIRLLAQGLTRMGYVVASIDYRIGMNIDDEELSKRAVYRAIQDSRSAVRFFRANASTYRIDPTKIFIGGHSAGAFMALHNVYMDKDSERPSSTKDTSQDGRMIPDLGCLDCVGNNLNQNGKANGVFSLAGALGDLSYIENSSEEGPLLFHSEDDDTVPYEVGEPFSNIALVTINLPTVYGSSIIKQRADELNIPAEFNSYTNRGHGVHENGTMALYEDILPTIGNWFFQQYLKPEEAALAGPARFCSEASTVIYNVVGDNYTFMDWTVTGGTIIAGDETTATVEVSWNPSAAERSLRVTPYLSNGAGGSQQMININQADGETNTWLGTASNLWDNHENWSNALVPLTCEEVMLPENAIIQLSPGKSFHIATLTLNENAHITIPESSQLIISQE